MKQLSSWSHPFTGLTPLQNKSAPPTPAPHHTQHVTKATKEELMYVVASGPRGESINRSTSAGGGGGKDERQRERETVGDKERARELYRTIKREEK